MLNVVKRSTIAVTGANGELANTLLSELLLHRCAARALVRSKSAAESLSTNFKNQSLDIRCVQYSNKESLTAALRGCTSIIHLVGILKETKRSSYLDAHEISTRTLVSAAKETSIEQIVNVSVLGAYPEHSNKCLRSRGRADDLLINSEIPCLILRVPMVLSPKNRAAISLRRKASRRFVGLLGGGHYREQPLDARDLIKILIRTATSPCPEAGIYDLAGPESLPQRDLIARAGALLGFNPHFVTIPKSVVRPLVAASEYLIPSPPLTQSMIDVLTQDDCIDTERACILLNTSLTPLDDTLRYVLLEDLMT